ncbi:MAG: helix-turn-helix transcriptional regulator [Bacteroidales bacterium]|nr:helix-turn-helix transcriptional regulator [Bacteroidales bacterium]
MNEDILLGNEKLKAIDINTHRPGVNIWIDFMHIYQFKPSEEFSVHAHENLEFHYIASGEGEVGFLKKGFNKDNVVKLPAVVKSQNKPFLKEFRLSQLITENKEYIIYKIKAGDAFLNPPGQFCWQKSSQENPLVEYALRFSFEEVEGDTSTGKYFKKENNIIKKLICQDIIQVTNGNEQLKKVFESVFLEARYEMPGYITKIKNEIYNLIIIIARAAWNKRRLKYFIPVIDITQKRLKLIEDYIQANITNNIKIENLAKNVNMSERNLSRFVKEIKGVSVHKYIIQIKVKIAVELISTTSKPLVEIAVLTGFSSPYHLSSTIKRIIGKNPSEL